MKLQVGLLVLWASTAMAACQTGTVPGPYTAQNVDFDVICGKGLSGSSYTSQASNQAGYIEMCMVACAVDSSCVAMVWDNIDIYPPAAHHLDIYGIINIFFCVDYVISSSGGMF
ncbi:putative MUC1-extracellular alpha-1,4-glucan glucosidase [Fusarium bulbicola]|nr:putative MUC1-extracellular alpha-1,4-glucan glucosidase [Fusarium bulbicola]